MNMNMKVNVNVHANVLYIDIYVCCIYIHNKGRSSMRITRTHIY